TVGFGTAQGTTIPVKEGGQVTLKRDENNNVVVTRYHPEFLSAAATAAGGTFIDASETDKASKVRQAVATLRAVGRAVEGGRTQTPRYQLFLLPALLLLLLDIWRCERRRRRVPTPAAASTAAAAAILLVMHGCSLPPNLTSQGAGAYHDGQFARAASLYKNAIRRGDRRTAVMYNLGTA